MKFLIQPKYLQRKHDSSFAKTLSVLNYFSPDDKLTKQRLMQRKLQNCGYEITKANFTI